MKDNIRIVQIVAGDDVYYTIMNCKTGEKVAPSTDADCEEEVIKKFIALLTQEGE